MSLATSVAGSTLRPQQHAKAQQNCTKTPQIQTNNSSTITTSTQAAVNCLQQSVSSSSPPTSIKTSLSTSPIAANFMGSSLFSFESGVVLSGSSGCCSLSNSPSSSSSSNSYLTSQSLENTCNKLQATNGNQICLNSSTSLEDSFHSATCQLNASLLAAVNADFEDDHHHVMAKSLNDNLNENETNLHTSTDTLQNHNENSENGQQRTHLMENTHNQHQSSAADSSSLNNEDARALQLAVELTMINLNQMPSPTSIAAQRTLSPTSSISSHHYQQLHHHQPSFATVGNPYHMTTKVFLQTQSQAAGALINRSFLNDASNQDNIPVTSPNQNLPNVTPPTTTTEERSKKSQNMTECVPVPSSEHVAEIVGRQGCKIKALRAKTNTYIKTPVRNEEPVFVVTGRKEDVAKAKREILSAAEHFTLIRATRRTNDSINGCLSGLAGAASGSGGGGGHLMSLNKNSLSMSAPLPGQITIQVRVPYRVVGLVVGPKGNTIKHIQHETQTYIVTPSRDKEPIFEVTGMPENVQMARKQIEAHIAYSLAVPQPAAPPPPPPPPPPAPGGAFERINESLNSNSAFHSLNSLNQMLNDDLHSEILTSIYKNGIGPALEYKNQIAGSSDTLNPVNKCNTANVYNSFASNDLNPSITSVNDLQRRVVINSTNNIQLNCNDFINTLMDSTSSNTPQFANEQNVNFPQLASNNTAIRNLKSVVNNINLLENTNTGTTSGLFHEQNKQNALLTRSCSSASSTTSSKSFNNNTNNTSQLWKSLGSATNNTCVVNDNIDVDEGIGESPLYSWGLPNTLAALTNSYCSPTSASISPTDSLFSEQNNKTAAANLQQQPLLKITSKTKLLEKLKCKKCWMCHEKDIVATFIPCGHTILCSLCANRLYHQTDANCLVCSTHIYQVIRVH